MPHFFASRWPMRTAVALILMAGLYLTCLALRSIHPALARQLSDAPHYAVLFNGKNLRGWIQVPVNSWRVKHGAMASLGVGRGMIYTARDFSHYRLRFTARQISGNHQACFLIFCSRPQPGKKPLDALAGIQFQIPNGGHWDYRKGHNNSGRGEFKTLRHKKFNIHKWYRVEITVNATAGTAHMAISQPLGSRFVPVLDFKNKAAGKVGPIAFQMHNKGLFDQYKNVEVEVIPTHPHSH